MEAIRVEKREERKVDENARTRKIMTREARLMLHYYRDQMRGMRKKRSGVVAVRYSKDRGIMCEDRVKGTLGEG